MIRALEAILRLLNRGTVASRAAMDATLRERWRSRQPMTEEEHRLMGTWPAGRLGPDRDWSVETLELAAELIERWGHVTFGKDEAIAIRDVLARLEKQS